MKYRNLPIMAVALATMFATSCSSLKFGSKKFECRNDLTKASSIQKAPIESKTTTYEAPKTSIGAKQPVEKGVTVPSILNTEKPAAKSPMALNAIGGKNTIGKTKTYPIATNVKIEPTSKIERKVTKDNINNEKKADDTSIILLYILAIFIPPLAVGIVTDWKTTPVLINIILCILFWLPGIIHAFYHIAKNRK